MKQKFPSLSRCASVCAVLMLALLVLQFLPFWNTGADTVSIGQYIWFPSDHADVTELIRPHTDGQIPINDVALPCVLMLLLSAGTLIFWIFSRKNLFLPLCSLIGSIAGIWVCIATPAFRMGNLWWLILVISLLGAAASLLTLFVRLQEYQTEA